MNDSNVFSLQTPAKDALTELAREGARQILAQAIKVGPTGDFPISGSVRNNHNQRPPPSFQIHV